jgi:hypothetical protein
MILQKNAGNKAFTRTIVLLVRVFCAMHTIPQESTKNKHSGVESLQDVVFSAMHTIPQEKFKKEAFRRAIAGRGVFCGIHTIPVGKVQKTSIHA